MLVNAEVWFRFRKDNAATPPWKYPSRDNPARQVAEAHKKVFRKRLRERAAAIGARHPAVLGDGLLLLIEGIYVTGQQSEDGPAQSAVTVARLLIDASVGKG